MQIEHKMEALTIVGERISRCVVTFLLALAATVSPAFSDGAIVSLMSEEDSRVLAEFDARREAAISMVGIGGGSAAVATLRQVLAGDFLPFDDGYE